MRKENLYLLLLASIQFIHVVDFMVIAPLGPQLMRIFGLTAEQFSYVFSAYTYSAGVMSFTAAFWLDRFDRKTALLLAFIGLIVGTALCGFAWSFELLLAARVVAGLFGGLLNALIFSIIGDMFGEERRGQAMGTVMAAFSVASVVGVPLGLKLGVDYGWNVPFLSVAALGILSTVACALFLPPMRGHLQGDGFRPRVDPLQTLSQVFNNPSERAALGLMFLVMLASFSVIPYISPYLVFNVGVAEADQAYVYLAGGIATLATSPIIGRLSDRLGKPPVFFWMALASGFVFLALTHLPAVPLWVALLVTTLFFITASGRMVPAMAMITGAVPTTRRGGFMSLSSSVQQLTAGTAALITGQLVVTLPDKSLEGYGWAGWIAVGATLLAFWVARQIRPAAEPAPQPVVENTKPEPELEAVV